MKIIAVDSDEKALRQLKKCLKSVFAEAEIVSFTSALDSIRYFSRNKAGIAAVFVSLVIKPFDGFSYSEMIDAGSLQGGIVFVTQTDSDEIRELIQLNGANRHIVKPVTDAKIRELAELEQQMCSERVSDGSVEYCGSCIYHWCGKRKSNACGSTARGI